MPARTSRAGSGGATAVWAMLGGWRTVPLVDQTGGYRMGASPTSCARFGAEVDYRNRPTGGFRARGTVTLEGRGRQRAGDRATTSLGLSPGAGLRIQLELLGPEYAMEFNSLSTGLKVFMSREVEGARGEDLVEKQNAEQGLMPVLEDEPGVWRLPGREPPWWNASRKGETPLETCRGRAGRGGDAGGSLPSAETGETVRSPTPGWKITCRSLRGGARRTRGKSFELSRRAHGAQIRHRPEADHTHQRGAQHVGVSALIRPPVAGAGVRPRWLSTSR